MKKIIVALLVVISGLLLTGCLGDDIGIDLDKAYPYRDDEVLGVRYNMSLTVGEDENYLYIAKGFYIPDNIAGVITGIRGTGEKVIVTIWVKNYSNKSVNVWAEQFNLVSDTGNVYSFDFDTQFETPSYVKTIQPQQDDYMIIYYKIRDKTYEDIKDWLLTYTYEGEGLFSTSKTKKVWAHIAYEKKEKP